MSARRKRWLARSRETARVLKLSRFDLKYSAGGLSHAKIMSTLELYGKEVIPRTRALLA